MAHNLNYNEQAGDYRFFSVKQKAWHGLGKIIQDYPTSAEAIKYAGLDYQVEKRPLFTVGNGYLNKGDETVYSEIGVPDFYATVRTDTEQVLGVVGNDYEVIQNINAFEFFDAIVGGKDGILYETAGAIGQNGSRIFITAKLPDYIRVGRDDLISQYLFLTTSHDGYGSITAAFTPVRVVCENTLNAALRHHSNSIKIRHTASANDRLKQAHTLMGITNKLANELEEVFNHWSRIRITDNAVKRLIQVAMAPNKEVLQNLQNGKQDELSTTYNNIVSSVMEFALTHPTQQEVTTKSTLYGAYNAVSGYFQNVRNYRDDEAKLKSIMYGTGLQRSQAAFDLCTQFAKYGMEALQLN